MTVTPPANLGLPEPPTAARSSVELEVEGWNAPGLTARLWIGAGTVRWYVLLQEPSVIEIVLEELHAHVGATFATVQLVAPSTTDVVDATAAELLPGGAVVRIDLPEASRASAARALRRFAFGWRERPAISTAAQRTTGEVLREYRLALSAGLFDEAQRCVESLRGMDELNAINVAYLEVEVLHSRRRYEDLLAHPHLQALLDGLPPIEVRNLVATAVLEARLRTHLMAPAAHAAEEFAKLDRRLWSMITSLEQVRTPAAALLLALDRHRRSVTLEDISGELLHLTLADTESHDLVRRLCDAGKSSTATVPEASTPQDEASRVSTTPDAVEVLKRYELDGQIDELLRLLPDVRPRLETLAIVRSVSYGIEDIDQLAMLVAHVDAADPGVLRSLRDNAFLQSGIDELRERATAATTLPGTWQEFLDHLETSGWSPRLRTLAEQDAPKWSFENIDADVARLCDALAQQSHETIDDLVPALLAWAEQAPTNLRSALLRLDLALLERLCLVDRSLGGRTHVLLIVDRLLSGGADADLYAEVLDQLEYRWGVDAAPDTVSWLSDALETLLHHPAASSARLEFATTAATAIVAFSSRVAVEDAQLIVALLEELGLSADVAGLSLEAPSQTPVDTGIPEDWSGITIGLYSLDRGVLRRSKTALEQRYPGIEVLENSDAVATEHLRAMAVRSDVVVVAWRVAKHPATEAIEAAIAPRPVQWAPGRGSSSMIETAAQALTKLRLGTHRPAA